MNTFQVSARTAARVCCVVVILGGCWLAWPSAPHVVRGADDKAAAPAEINFVAASGIARGKLAKLVDDAIRTSGTPTIPLTMTLANDHDQCLAKGEVTVTWKGGAEKIAIPQSGLIVFALDKSRLEGLTIRAPHEYTHLKQLSFAVGPAYQPMKPVELGFPVIDDGELKSTLRRKLVEIRHDAKATGIDKLHEQLDRHSTALKLPSPTAETLTPAEIYRRLRPSVVVMGTLGKQGQLFVAGGFVLDPTGIVVTNYHVMDHTAAEVDAVGVMTSDGRVFPVVEVLAADQASDVAIVRIEANDLTAATLSSGEPPGSPVTIIAHPAGRFYFLTQGVVSRYSEWINHGRQMISMSVTAEFCPGSSGSPVFAADGSVAGIVSSINELGGGMVDKQCMPAHAIRELLTGKP